MSIFRQLDYFMSRSMSQNNFFINLYDLKHLKATTVCYGHDAKIAIKGNMRKIESDRFILHFILFP